MMTSEAEQREARARDLREEVRKLSEASGALEGLAVLGDGWAQTRLGQVNAAIHERTGRLTDLALEQREARR